MSNTAAAGKTQLLYSLIAAGVLPSSSSPPTPHRPPGAVVVIDTDNRFDVERLVQVMTSQYRSAAADGTTTTDSPVEVLHGLQHIHIFRPQSLASLLSTLRSLPDYLLDMTQHSSAHRSLSLLAVDSMTAFYWPERSEQEMAYLASEEGEQGLRQTRNTYSEIVTALRHIQATFACPVVATSWSLSGSRAKSAVSSLGSSNSPTSTRPLLPGVWNQYVTARLLVSRENVRKFPAGLTAEQAERDRIQRQEVLQRSRFRAEVDWWVAESWPEARKQGLVREARLRGLGFIIRHDSVLIDG